MQADPADHRTRMTKNSFNTFMQWYLGLPLCTDTRPATNSTILGYRAAWCEHTTHRQAGKEGLLDANGDHACGCPSAAVARVGTHNEIVSILHQAAKEAGFDAYKEPSMSMVLHNQYDERECALNFPDVSSREKRERIQRARELVDKLHKKRPENCLTPRERTALQNELDFIIDGVMKHQKAMRFDIYIKSPANPRISYVTDFSQTHATQKAMKKKTLSFLCQERSRIDEQALAMGSTRKVLNCKISSPAVRVRADQKAKKYEAPVELAKKQWRTNRRPDRLTFIPLVMTHRGEMGGGIFELIEVMAMQIKGITAKLGERAYVDPRKAAANFRRKTKDRMAVAMATGWAAQLTSAGKPTCVSLQNTHAAPPALRGSDQGTHRTQAILAHHSDDLARPATGALRPQGAHTHETLAAHAADLLQRAIGAQSAHSRVARAPHAADPTQHAISAIPPQERNCCVGSGTNCICGSCAASRPTVVEAEI